MTLTFSFKLQALRMIPIPFIPIKNGSVFSKTFHRSMSIPVTLSELHGKLEKIPPAPLSPCRQATPKVKKYVSSSPCSAGTDTSSMLAAFSQRAPVTDEGLCVSGSDCYATSVAKSEPLPEINTCANFSLYPFSPVGVFPQWMTNTSQPPELIRTFHLMT